MHRIGRAGRAGAKGLAISLITPSHGPIARELVAMLHKSNVHVPPELQRVARSGGGSDGYRRWHR